MSDYRLKGASGAIFGQIWQLGNETLLGIADDCQVRIDAPEIALRHARIIFLDGQPWIENLAENGVTYVNETAIDQQVLKTGDEIRIGQYRLMLQAPGLRPRRLIKPAVEKQEPRRWIGWVLIALALGGSLTAAWYWFL